MSFPLQTLSVDFPLMIEYAGQEADARLNNLVRELARCEQSADPDGVHELRVATRRLGSCLESFEQFFPKKLQKERRRLSSIRKLAGPIRDLDVTLELLSGAGVSLETSLAQSLLERRSQSFRELERGVKQWRRRHVDRLRAGLRNGYSKERRLRKAGKKNHRLPLDALKSPGDNAAAVLPKLTKRFFRAGGKVQTSSVEAKDLHRFRIRLKRFRYTLELFRPCYGKELSEYVAQLKRLQDHLGRLNDCQTALGLLHETRWAVSHPNAARTVRDYLVTLQAEEVQRFRDCWRNEFDRRERHQWNEYFRRPQQNRHLAA